MNFLLYLSTAALLVSFFADRKKTVRALKIAVQKFAAIVPAFTVMLVIVSIVLYFFPQELISKHLAGENKYWGVLLASVLGSVTLMPGFIAFPLCGILLENGVTYMVLSAFTTTLMMVGVLTFPIEKEYFGVKVTLVRNTLSFVIAVIVALVTGLFFGEL